LQCMVDQPIFKYYSLGGLDQFKYDVRLSATSKKEPSSQLSYLISLIQVNITQSNLIHQNLLHCQSLSSYCQLHRGHRIRFLL
jgi:hypothetical protein